LFLLHLFWHASLGVCSAKRRHQSPEWTILSHIDCFIQGEVFGFQVLLDSLHPCNTRASWWSPPDLQREQLLRSSWHLFRLSFGHCGQTEKRCAWTMVERGGCILATENRRPAIDLEPSYAVEDCWVNGSRVAVDGGVPAGASAVKDADYVCSSRLQ